MNTLLYKGIMMAALVCLFSACSSSDAELNPSAEGDGGVLSSHAISLSPVGGEWNLTVTSIVPWHLDIPEEGKWIQASTLSGKEGTTVVKLKASVNSSRKNRYLVIKCGADDGSFDEQITITQPYPYLRVRQIESPDQEPADTIRFDWNQYEKSSFNSSPLKLMIESNVDWRVISDRGDVNSVFDTVRTHKGVFLGLSTLEGNGDTRLDILPHFQNIDTLFHQVSFKIVPVARNQSGNYMNIRDMGQDWNTAIDEYSFHAIQSNMRFLVNDSAVDKTFSISELGESLSFMIDAEESWMIVIDDEISWLEFSRKNGEAGKSELTITTEDANPSKSERVATVNLKSESGAFRTIRIQQRPFILDVDSDTFVFSNNDPSEKSFHVKTTGSIELEGKPEWLSFSKPLYCESDSTYLVTVSLDKVMGQNLSFSTLIASGLCVKSTNNSLSCALNVSQDPFLFSLTPDQLRLPTNDTESHVIHISVSGNWTAEVDGNWLLFQDSEGNPVTSGTAGEHDLSVRASSANPDLKESRKATVTILSCAHANRDEEYQPLILEVTQERLVFEVTDPDGKDDFSYLTAIPAHRDDFPEYSIGIKCSVPWTLTAPDWLTPSHKNGDPDDSIVKVTLTPSSNFSTSSPGRSGAIIITPTVGDPMSILVHQNAFLWFVLSSEELHLQADDTMERTIKVTCSSDWTVRSSDTSVVDVAKKNDSSFIIVPVKNESGQIRTAEITVQSSVGNHTRVIKVEQDAF